VSWKSWKKKMKKTFAFKAAKAFGRANAKIVKYGAPVVGAVLGGPIGAAAGTALSGAASQVGPNKSRGAALKRALIYGGSITAGTAALGVLSGAGIGSSVLTSGAKLLGGGPVAPVSDQPKAGTSGLDEGFWNTSAPAPGQGPQGGSIFGALPVFNPFGRTAGDMGVDPSPGDPRQGGGFLPGLADLLGAEDGPGFFETDEGKPDLVKIGLAAAAAYFVFFRKRAA
jgi:hypothetical protein